MKTVEKMILCCIWICIAIVAVLIKDQTDLKKNIQIQHIEKMDQSEIEKKSQIVVLNEVEVMEIVASNMPVMRDATLSFQEDGQIQMNVTVDDALLNEADAMISNETVSMFLPLLKGMEVVCQASISSDEIGLSGCKAGFLSVPEELLEIVEKQLNETWSEIVKRKGIEQAEVSLEGLELLLKPE